MTRKANSAIRITREQALAGASEQSARRGEEYAAGGAVHSTVRQGRVLRALVEGSSYEPYEVTIRLEAHGVGHTECSCPYSWGGDCKHIVAVLLTWASAPEEFVRQAPVAELLVDLDEGGLRRLLIRATDEVTGFDAWLRDNVPEPRHAAAEEELSVSTAREKWKPRVEKILRQVRGVGHFSDAPERVAPLMATARELLAQHDANTALGILLAITAPLASRYEQYEGEVEVAELLEYDLTRLLNEAVRLADLTDEERQGLLEEFSALDEAFAINYGLAPFGKMLEGLARQ